MIKYSRQSLALTAFAAAALLSACSDDDFGKDGKYYSDHICFSADKMTWGDMEDTRAVGNPTDFVLRDRNSRDTLCMKQIVTRGIHTEKNPQTRGTQVTSTAGINSFGVFAYTQQGGVEKLYMNNEQYTKNAENIFEAQTIYYWPGASLTFDFYTYSPYAATGLGLPGNAGSKILEYKVPTDVSKQQDLMLAVNKAVPGNNNAAVPLSFTHLLTAVNLVSGSQMVDGTITSVKFTGLEGNGTIDMSNTAAGWTYLAPTERTSYTVSPNVAISSSMAAGTNLLGEGNTFLLLPQTLNQDENTIEITITKSDGTTRVLSSPLTGNWAMGTTNTYRLSITPEYEMKFEEADIPTQDAHYTMFTTKVIADRSTGDNWSNWTVTVDGAPDASVQLESVVNDFAKQGFWTDKVANNGTPSTESARGTASVTSAQEGTIEVRVFLPENTGTADRTVTLNLSADDGTSVASKTVTQKAAATVNGVNWEVIQEDTPTPWGFDSETNVVYVYRHVSWIVDWAGSLLNSLHSTLENLVTQYNASGWAHIGEYVPYGLSTFYYVNIDYSEFNELNNNAQSTADGHTNTTQLFNFAGAAYSKAFETSIQNLQKAWTGNPLMVKRENCSITLPSTVPHSNETQSAEASALIDILKKNRYYLNNVTGEDEITTKAPLIKVEDIKWYMPASGQFNGMPAWTTPAGAAGAAASDIWSSTGIAGNSPKQAYLGSGTAASRTTSHHVRAARVSN